MSRRQFPCGPPNSASQSFCPSFAMAPEPWVSGGIIPQKRSRLGLSTPRELFSVLLDVNFSVSCHLLHKGTFPRRSKYCSNLTYYSRKDYYEKFSKFKWLLIYWLLLYAKYWLSSHIQELICVYEEVITTKQTLQTKTLKHKDVSNCGMLTVSQQTYGQLWS